MSNHKIKLLFLTIGLLIYANALRAGFQFDDYAGILENPAVRNLSDLKAIADAFNTRFILGLSFAFNYFIGRYSTFGFHLFNISTHILSSVLVYSFISLTFKTPGMKAKHWFVEPRWTAFFTALLFLVHPIQTQAVTYVWQRSASLAAFFYLLSMVVYVRSRLKPSLFLRSISWIACLAGIFTKEIVITLPLTLALYEFIFFKGLETGWIKKISILWPFFLLLPVIPITLTRAPSVTLEVMRLKTSEQGAMGGQAGEKKLDVTRFVGEDVMKRKDYLLTELNVVRTYFRLLFIPIRQNLDYDYPVSKTFFETKTVLSALFLIGVLLAAFFSLRAWPMVSFGIFWFFLALSVESLVVQSDVIFEHRLYLPMAGFSMAIVAALGLAMKKYKSFVVLMSVIAIIFSVMTYFRNRVWQNDYTLWGDVTAKSPEKFRGYSNLALAYEKDKDYKKAIYYFKESIKRAPREARERCNLGAVYLRDNKPTEAVEAFQNAIELKPAYSEAFNNMGVAYIYLGKKEEALAAFNEAVKIDPDLKGARQNLLKLVSDLNLAVSAK